MKPFNNEIEEFLDVPPDYIPRSRSQEFICFALLVVVIILLAILVYSVPAPV